MTKKQAHAYARRTGQTHGLHVFDIDKVIDAIYSDRSTELCENCISRTNGTCYSGELDDAIYPDYEVLDDSGFYVKGYDVEPNYGCIYFKRRITDEQSASN